MADKLRILIVEDELIIAEDLKEILEGLNYDVCGIAMSMREGAGILAETSPDLVLLDIQLKGEKDGIDFAEHIRSHYRIPYIFLTSHIDPDTMRRAKAVYPNGYLVKPYQVNDIYTTIELAMNNFSKEQQSTQVNTEQFVLNDCLFVRNGGMLVKLGLGQIKYLEADANYTKVVTDSKQYVLRSTLKELENELKLLGFARIHKSYLINLNAIDAIDSQMVLLGQKAIPISRSQYGWLLHQVKTI